MINSRCYIVLNKGLEMPVGKLAVQVGHAMDQVWDCVDEIRKNSSYSISIPQLDMLSDFHVWRTDGRKKVLLSVKNDTELLKYKDKLLESGHVVLDIIDNGVNFFDGKTRTGFVVFPVLNDIPALKRLQVYK